jgi:hypothetical protein
MLQEWDEACAVEVDGIDPDPDSDSDLHETRRPSPVLDNGSVAPLPFRLISLNLAAPPVTNRIRRHACQPAAASVRFRTVSHPNGNGQL